MLKNKLIICGDSFNIGIGCNDLYTEPYGVLLANTLDMDLVNLAKGSSTNLSIFLQVEYAVRNIASHKDIVIVSHTSYDRVDWLPWDDNDKSPISNLDVNYHQYPPYGEGTYHQILSKHPMHNDSRYKGRMFTENFLGVIDYWETFRKDDKDAGHYFAKFKNEPKERMKTLYDFATTVHDSRLNRIQSIGLMTLAHNLLKKHNINHLVLTGEPVEYAKYIDSANIVELDWGKLSIKYPDEIKSLHTGPQGHKEAHDVILTNIKKLGWLK